MNKKAKAILNGFLFPVMNKKYYCLLEGAAYVVALIVNVPALIVVFPSESVIKRFPLVPAVASDGTVNCIPLLFHILASTVISIAEPVVGLSSNFA